MIKKSKSSCVKELKYENALNNYVPKETIQQRHFEFSGSLPESSLPEKNILDKIKDFFRNFTWPSCCQCNNVNNEPEINMQRSNMDNSII